MLMHAGQINYLDEPLLLYRIHGNNDNGSLAIFGRDTRIKGLLRHLVLPRIEKQGSSIRALRYSGVS